MIIKPHRSQVQGRLFLAPIGGRMKRLALVLALLALVGCSSSTPSNSDTTAGLTASQLESVASVCRDINTFYREGWESYGEQYERMQPVILGLEKIKHLDPVLQDFYVYWDAYGRLVLYDHIHKIDVNSSDEELFSPRRSALLDAATEAQKVLDAADRLCVDAGVVPVP